MCFRKKQSKKEDKPLKAEIRLSELVGEKDDVENRADGAGVSFSSMGMGGRTNRPPQRFEWKSSSRSNACVAELTGLPNDLNEKLYAVADVSSSSMTNDFHKVKTFDLRGVTESTAK